jgi:Kef-type K+ transport system membrane component KefB
LLLTGTGILIRATLDFYNLPIARYNVVPLLRFLGIIGLVMIVLEAALDLKINREKTVIIRKAFFVALATLIVVSLVFAAIFQTYFSVNFSDAYINALPLAIVSSAIVIPSVMGLSERKKEFMIYEATFSDILGIMLFFFVLIGLDSPPEISVTRSILTTLLFTLIISVGLSYALAVVFQNITSKTKLFLLVAVLLLLYSIGKLLHTSSLLIILFFGILLNNRQLFFPGPLRHMVDDEKMEHTLRNFQILTLETSFVIRTLFFLVFGLSIEIGSLININTMFLSLIMVGLLFVLRYLCFVIFARDFTLPALFVSPRGLVTILLIFSIPAHHAIPGFEAGILLYLILVTSLVMGMALFSDRRSTKLKGLLKVTGMALSSGEMDTDKMQLKENRNEKHKREDV